MPGTVLGAEDMAVNKTEIPALGGLMVKWRRPLGCLPFPDGLYYKILSLQVPIATWTMVAHSDSLLGIWNWATNGALGSAAVDAGRGGSGIEATTLSG